MRKYRAVLIPGDGIGPEVTGSVSNILEAAQAPIEFVEHSAGLAALEKGLPLVPEETVQAIRQYKVALKGPCTTPVGEGFASVNVQLRQRLNLYAAVRPVRNVAGIKTGCGDVDIVVIRENTEGLYCGAETQIAPGLVTSLKVCSQDACQRIARWAFRFATVHRRHKVTVFHKANIMKLTDGLFLRCARHVHEQEYPNVGYEEMIVDAGSMKLVQDPSRFDVLLMENLYGDIISDLCAGLVGGLGVVPGANFGDEAAVFEAVHGSAPDIAGQDRANPSALLMSALMMLEHLARVHQDDVYRHTAERIRVAHHRTLAAGQKTCDVGGKLGTTAFANAVTKRLAG